MEIRGRKLKKIIDRKEIKKRLRELAREIEETFREDFVAVGLLKGSFIFIADLVREFKSPVTVDFIWVSSYGSSMESQRHVRVLKDLETDVEGKRVLLVDDILDTGHTLKEVKDLLRLKGAKSVKVCVLLDKKERREVNIKADFVGFEVPNMFFVGYGLDWAEQGRNLKDIYAVE